MLDPTDLGLAFALAGRAEQAVAVLEPAAQARLAPMHALARISLSLMRLAVTGSRRARLPRRIFLPTSSDHGWSSG